MTLRNCPSTSVRWGDGASPTLPRDCAPFGSKVSFRPGGGTCCPSSVALDRFSGSRPSAPAPTAVIRTFASWLHWWTRKRRRWRKLRPVSRGAVVTLLSRQHTSECLRSPFRSQDPRTTYPRRVMAYMLVVATLEPGHPLMLVVLIEADDASIHVPCPAVLPRIWLEGRRTLI